MQSALKRVKRPSGSIVFSLVLHGCALLFVLWCATLPRVKQSFPDWQDRSKLKVYELAEIKK